MMDITSMRQTGRKGIAAFAGAYGPWALVTGASHGLGAEFARQLAALGLNVVLVARSGDELRARADEIERAASVRGRTAPTPTAQTQPGQTRTAPTRAVQTRTVPLDLSRDDAVDRLVEATSDLEIGLLVNNAGISSVGPFLSLDSTFLDRQVMVNNRAGLLLARHFGAQMVRRGHGGMIFVSSGSALHGTPWSASYCGTKAFSLMVAEALWYELRPRGVDVLGWLAGATRTPGFLDNRPGRSALVPVGEARPAVTQALRALGRRPSVADGRLNRLGYGFMGLLPRSLAVRLLGRSMSDMFGPFADWPGPDQPQTTD